MSTVIPLWGFIHHVLPKAEVFPFLGVHSYKGVSLSEHAYIPRVKNAVLSSCLWLPLASSVFKKGAVKKERESLPTSSHAELLARHN